MCRRVTLVALRVYVSSIYVLKARYQCLNVLVYSAEAYTQFFHCTCVKQVFSSYFLHHNITICFPPFLYLFSSLNVSFDGFLLTEITARHLMTSTRWSRNLTTSRQTCLSQSHIQIPGMGTSCQLLMVIICNERLPLPCPCSDYSFIGKQVRSTCNLHVHALCMCYVCVCLCCVHVHPCKGW